jgi:monothiol glutaredoxin
MPLTDALRARFDALVRDHDVVLFMKGERRAPSCGFSAQVVSILDELLDRYATVDVLENAEVRDGIKEYSQWPTIPQLYVKGKFVGGCDIVREMHAAGELAELLGVDANGPSDVTVDVTAAAAQALQSALEGAGSEGLHLAIDARFAHELYVGPREDGEREVRARVPAGAPGVAFLLDAKSLRRANGVVIDFVTAANGSGFRIDNPNEPPKVRSLSAKELDAKRRAGEPLHLFDVRTPAERATAVIDGSILLDDEGAKALDALPRDATVVFQCHHGVRSRAAAERALARGFTRVFNLEGGIDAWSVDVDPRVPRY